MFTNYWQFINELKQRVGETFYQWIDGIFTTQKNNPVDIDVITFVDYRIFKETKLLFMDTRALKAEKGIDLYFVLEYPVEHPLRFATELDKIQWLSVFSFSRRTIDNQIYLKRHPANQVE